MNFLSNIFKNIPSIIQLYFKNILKDLFSKSYEEYGRPDKQ